MRKKTTIHKHKISLQKGFVSKLNIDNWAEYQYATLQHSNKSKLKKVLTLREYYDLIKSGYSGRDLKQQGYDKHLIFFYNKLLKGEILVAKKDFEKDYLDGISLDEISKKYAIDRGCTTFLRELFGIKRKGATYIKRKSTDIELNSRQKELLYGTLMGDGKKASSSSFAIRHSSKFSDYVIWKYDILKNVASSTSLKEETSYDKRYDVVNKSLKFYTHANSDVEFIINQFYGDGAKKITSEILDQITDFGLAIWYMDDGKIDWNYHSRQRNINSRPSISLCTDSFSLDECQLIKEFFKTKWNINCYLRSVRSNQYRIKFGVESTEKFLLIVSPYVIPCMQYKIHYNAYLGYRKSKESLIRYKIQDCPLGENFNNLEETKKDLWIEAIYTKLRKNKFPYPNVSDESIQKFFKKLRLFDCSNIINKDAIGYHSYPVSILPCFHPHFYKMNRKGTLSPFEIFQEDNLLREAIVSIVKRNNFPSSDAIRREIGRYKVISSFPAFGAKAIFEKFCNKTNSVAVDFCAGFGGRMLGAISCSKICNYLACEPNTKTHIGLNSIINKYRENDENINNTEVTISNTTAEMFLMRLEESVADIVFTSPPYFDAEIYEKNLSQSMRSFPRYGEWLQEWLLECINQSLRILRSDGILILNIANCNPYAIADDTLKILRKKSENVFEWRIYLSSKKTEPLLILTKGSSHGSCY